MSQEPDFFSFDEALDRLHLKEEELKRLVSEGEIRAFREGETMKLRKHDVEELRNELMGGEIVEFDDVVEPLGSGAEDLVFDDDPDLVDPGMATEELTAADTLIEEEATEFFEDLEELDLDDAETLEVAGAASGAVAAAEEFLDDDDLVVAGSAAADDEFSPLAFGLIMATFFLMLLTLPLLISQSAGVASDISKSIAGVVVEFDE